MVDWGLLMILHLLPPSLPPNTKWEEVCVLGGRGGGQYQRAERRLQFFFFFFFNISLAS